MIIIAKQSEEIPEEIFDEAPSPQEDISSDYPKEDTQINFNEDRETIIPEQEYPRANPSYNPSDVESKIQEVAELIVDEKWEDLTKRIGNLALWKSRVETEITSIKQEVFRMQSNIQGLQNAIAGRLNEYNQNIMNVNSEMKALESVLQKILEPLSQNIKELNRLSNEFKGKTIKK